MAEANSPIQLNVLLKKKSFGSDRFLEQLPALSSIVLILSACGDEIYVKGKEYAAIDPFSTRKRYPRESWVEVTASQSHNPWTIGYGKTVP